VLQAEVFTKLEVKEGTGPVPLETLMLLLVTEVLQPLLKVATKVAEFKPELL
jgi:hypothetical protein